MRAVQGCCHCRALFILLLLLLPCSEKLRAGNEALQEALQEAEGELHRLTTVIKVDLECAGAARL